MSTMQPTPRSWLQRNTKWIVLSAVALGLALVAMFIVAIVMIVAGALKSNDVYRDSLARAQSHPQVIERLGQPIEAGFMPSGSINVENRTGDADLQIPISGPKGEASIEVIARKRDDTWTYERMQVGDIDLLDGG